MSGNLGSVPRGNPRTMLTLAESVWISCESCLEKRLSFVSVFLENYRYICDDWKLRLFDLHRVYTFGSVVFVFSIIFMCYKY